MFLTATMSFGLFYESNLVFKNLFQILLSISQPESVVDNRSTRGERRHVVFHSSTNQIKSKHVSGKKHPMVQSYIQGVIDKLYFKTETAPIKIQVSSDNFSFF